MSGDKRFAVLVDADNISSQYIKIVMDEISNVGFATYKRIYGDWTGPGLNSWKRCLLQYAITPIQQYSYTSGKNATDSAMIIEAMDILYTGKVDGYCLVSSDSDFTRLAIRLREAGMDVIGMGESKSPPSFISACNQFKYLDVLLSTQKKAMVDAGNKKKAQSKPDTSRPIKTSITTIKETIEHIVGEASGEDGWLLLSTLGTILRNRHPDFDVRNYGYSKLIALIADISTLEMRNNPGPTGIPVFCIKIKDDSVLSCADK